MTEQQERDMIHAHTNAGCKFVRHKSGALIITKSVPPAIVEPDTLAKIIAVFLYYASRSST
jgi:hypothetical protein